MPIKLVSTSPDIAQVIEQFGSTGAAGIHLAAGRGESHVYIIHLLPGGVIGPHPAGFDQLFLVLNGAGWVAGADGMRHPVDRTCGAFIPTGELHAKGSETGMMACMIQSSQFADAATAPQSAEISNAI